MTSILKFANMCETCFRQKIACICEPKHKKCQFCGSTDTYCFYDKDHTHVSCATCGARGPVASTVKDAVRLWNTHYETNEQQLQGEG